MKKSPQLIDFGNLPFPARPTHAVFDVDGTLTDHNSVTSARTLGALRRLSEAGIPVMVATGRILSGGLSILERAGINGWVVAGAGSVVHNGHQIVHTHYLPPELIHEALTACRTYNLVPYFYIADDIIVDKNARFIPDLLENANEGLPLIHADLHEIDWSQVAKFTFSAEKELLDDVLPILQAQFPELVRGHDLFLDLPVPGISKWNGIAEALDDQGLDAATGIGIGDSGNDVPWLPNIGYPIAAPHSTPDVLEVCDWILPNVEDPVAQLIEAILEDPWSN